MFEFLFGFRGRTNRLKVWIFSITISIIEVIAVAVAFTIYPSPILVVWMYGAPDPRVFQNIADWWVASSLDDRLALGAVAAIKLLIAYMTMAVLTKRLHDLDKRIWWLIPFWIVPQACSLVLSYLDPEQAAPILWVPLLLLCLPFAIWGFVQLFCYSGTPGENRFGRDPLGGPVINPFQGEKPRIDRPSGAA